MISNIYSGVVNIAYLLKSSHGLKRKALILLTWVKINLKKTFFPQGYRKCTENIFGFEVLSPKYSTICFLFEEIFFRNEYMVKFSNPNPVIFDCGAHIGMATIFFKWVYPDSTIYSFEPDKQTFSILKKNILCNKLKKIKLFNLALTNKGGLINFFTDLRHGSALTMSTSYERNPKDKIKVRSQKLSSFIERNNIDKIDLLKLDIEGSEREVIEDLASNNFFSVIEKIVIEYHHNYGAISTGLARIVQILENNGYKYQLDARNVPITSENHYQDILIYGYKP